MYVEYRHRTHAGLAACAFTLSLNLWHSQRGTALRHVNVVCHIVHSVQLLGTNHYEKKKNTKRHSNKHRSNVLELLEGWDQRMG